MEMWRGGRAAAAAVAVLGLLACGEPTGPAGSGIEGPYYMAEFRYQLYGTEYETSGNSYMVWELKKPNRFEGEGYIALLVVGVPERSSDPPPVDTVPVLGRRNEDGTVGPLPLRGWWVHDADRATVTPYLMNGAGGGTWLSGLPFTVREGGLEFVLETPVELLIVRMHRPRS